MAQMLKCLIYKHEGLSICPWHHLRCVSIQNHHPRGGRNSQTPCQTDKLRLVELVFSGLIEKACSRLTTESGCCVQGSLRNPCLKLKQRVIQKASQSMSLTSTHVSAPGQTCVHMRTFTRMQYILHTYTYNMLRLYLSLYISYHFKPFLQQKRSL